MDEHLCVSGTQTLPSPSPPMPSNRQSQRTHPPMRSVKQPVYSTVKVKWQDFECFSYIDTDVTKYTCH